MEKYIPKVGDKLNIVNYYCSTSYPYEVTKVSGRAVEIRRCKLIYNTTPIYFNSMPSSIESNPNGEIRTIHYAPKRKLWQLDKYNVAVFGEWEYEPYLD